MAYTRRIKDMKTGEVVVETLTDAEAIARGLRPTDAEQLAATRDATTVPLGDLLGNMVEAGWINEAAGEQWLERRAIPAPLVSEIQARPSPKTRITARATFFAASVWRMDPVWNAAFARFGKTDIEIDAVFGIDL